MNSVFIKTIKLFILLGLIGFTTYILFSALGRSALDNWDEAWYGEVSKQIIQTGNYIRLSWNGGDFLDKPPLYMWIVVAVSNVLGGLTEYVVRFPSALAGFTTIVLVLYFTIKNYGLIPSVIGTCSLIFNDVYIWRTRSGNLDASATLWIFLIYLLLVSKVRYKYQFIGILLALTYLTKAAIVILPLTIVLVTIIFIDKSKTKQDYLHYFTMFSLFFIPIIIWLFAGYSQEGKGFVNYFLYHSDQNVARLSLANYNLSYVSYIYYAFQRRLIVPLLFGVASSVALIKEKKNILLLLFSIPFLIALSFSPRANNWYLLPIFPFLSILIAQGILYIFSLTRQSKIVKIGAILVCSYIFFKAFNINIKPIINTYSTNNQRESGLALRSLSNPSDTIVRLNQAYPATIYYSDRKVLVYKNDPTTSGMFIGTSDLHELIGKGEVKWFSGTPAEIELYSRSVDMPYEIISVNNSEQILKIISNLE